jgi:hypothetical protein
MGRVLGAARDRGVLIIHAPSGCMAAYKDHPDRARARRTPRSKSLPTDIGTWCYQIPRRLLRKAACWAVGRDLPTSGTTAAPPDAPRISAQGASTGGRR